MAISKKKLISNIIFYVVLAFFFGVAVFAIVTKLNGGAIYLFNNRVDIVLTDSMSVRNEHHLDFLEGTQQIQPYDMVVSETINANTELKVKDCVLYRNPNYSKPVVHRIISISEQGTEFKVNQYQKKTFNNEEVVSLDPLYGSITMAILDFKDIEIVAYTPVEYSSYFVLLQGKNAVETTVETTNVSTGVYRHVIKYHKDSSSPYRTTIAPSNDREMYIASVNYKSFSSGNLTFKASELDGSKNTYKKLFNGYYLYEIRGDKANAADGFYPLESLISKVNVVIPKLGYIAYFLQTLPGIFMMVGLALVIAVASFFWTKPDKKDKGGNKEEMVPVEGEVVDNPPEVEEDKKPDKDKESDP